MPWADGTTTPRTPAQLEASILAYVDAAIVASEDVSAIYADELIASYAQSDPFNVPFVTGKTYIVPNHAGLTTGTTVNNRMVLMPFRPARNCTLTSISVETTVAGEAGAKIRLVVYEDISGLPSIRLYDSGQLAGDAAPGTVSGTGLSVEIAPSKLYWSGYVAQVATTTRPTIRVLQSVPASFRVPNATGTPSSRASWLYDGVTGVPPSPLVNATLTETSILGPAIVLGAA